MKKINVLFAAIIGATMCLSSCTEEVMNLENAELSGAYSPNAALRIHTRGDAVASGRIYVFQDETCVRVLSTEDDGETTEAFFEPGTYTIYAVGSDDLSAFTLPERETASPSSVITLAAGHEMGDLLMDSQSVTLEKGVPQDLTLTLTRQVFRIEEVSVEDVPAEVTAVEINISSIRPAIKLDGTLTGETMSITIPLTQGSGQTWSATPHQYAFPTNGNPVISISLTFPSGIKTYTKAMEEAITANHKLQIEATYAEPLYGSFAARLVCADWDSPQSFDFDFTETNLANPVVGEKYMNYFVVSVNTEAKTAVLLAKNKVSYTAPGDGASQDEWLTQLDAAMSTLPKPYRAMGDWRLPTLSEIQVITGAASLYETNKSTYYFFLDSGTLKNGHSENLDTTPVFYSNPTWPNSKLRPVIDVAY